MKMSRSNNGADLNCSQRCFQQGKQLGQKMGFGMAAGIGILYFHGNIDKRLLVMKYMQNKNK